MSHDPWDEVLRTHLQSEPEPTDDGFSLRVMAALPAQQRHFGVSSMPMRAAALTAMGVAVAALATLADQGLGNAEQLVSTLSVLALLSWWSLPTSRGNLWC